MNTGLLSAVNDSGAERSEVRGDDQILKCNLDCHDDFTCSELLVF